jgi:cbb3-type cytochrome oxidase maturation protein
VPVFLVIFKINRLSALFILIGISILVAGSFLAAFLWSVKDGQYDDDYTPSIRMLFDDTLKSKASSSSSKKKLTQTK